MSIDPLQLNFYSAINYENCEFNKHFINSFRKTFSAKLKAVHLTNYKFNEEKKNTEKHLIIIIEG